VFQKFHSRFLYITFHGNRSEVAAAGYAEAMIRHFELGRGILLVDTCEELAGVKGYFHAFTAQFAINVGVDAGAKAYLTQAQ
jgi:hypothetical protein